MSQVLDRRIVEFLTPVREFIVLNATDERVEIAYSGETRYVPPNHVILGDGEPFQSAKDSEGNYIPGTLVIEDMFEQKELGEMADLKIHWSAAEAIKHSLGINVRTGEATGHTAKKGVSVLPPKPTPELVDKIRSEGRARYEDWMVDSAKNLVDSYDAKNEARQRVGMNAVPPGKDYERAFAILNAHRKRQQTQAEGDLGLQPTDDFEADLAAAIMAKLGGVEEDKEALVARLMNDKEFVKALKQKYAVRKKRKGEGWGGSQE